MGISGGFLSPSLDGGLEEFVLFLFVNSSRTATTASRPRSKRELACCSVIVLAGILPQVNRKSHARTVTNYKMDYRISDPAGKFLLEGLDPSDSFMMSVKLEELPGDKFWTIWTFPPVKANGKPLRLVLEDRYKEVKRIPEL